MICKPENKMHNTFTDSILNTLRRNRNRTLVKMLKLSVWSIIKFLVTQKQPNNIVVIGGACTLYYHRIFAFNHHIRWLKLPNISKLFGHSYLGLIGRNLKSWNEMISLGKGYNIFVVSGARIITLSLEKKDNDFHFVHTGNIAPKPLLLFFLKESFSLETAVSTSLTEINDYSYGFWNSKSKFLCSVPQTPVSVLLSLHKNIATKWQKWFAFAFWEISQ